MKTLRKLREEKALSQERMAMVLGVSVSLYVKIEQGKARASRGFMDKLKRAYPEISIDEMFFSK